jgi:Effector Associated Constant Component 1
VLQVGLPPRPATRLGKPTPTTVWPTCGRAGRGGAAASDRHVNTGIQQPPRSRESRRCLCGWTLLGYGGGAEGGVGVDVAVRVEGPGAADELRSLRMWLIDDDDFRGRVRLHEAGPARGTLSGGIVSELTIVVGSLGTALATVLVTWLKTRVGRVKLRVTRPDGAVVELDAEQVRGLDAEGAWHRAAQVADLLNADPRLPGPAAGTTADGGDGDPPRAGVGDPAASEG